MILGALDQGSVSAGGGGGSGTATLDFAANTYTVNGGSLTLADVVDLTARRSSSGLEVISGTPVEMLGDARDILLAGQWTVVIEFDAGARAIVNGVRAFLLTVWNSGLADQAALYTQAFPSPSEFFATYSEDPGTGTTRFWQTDDSAPTGVAKMAWTRTDAHSAGEMNGNSVNVDSTDDTGIAISSWTFPPARVQIADGNDGSNSLGYIRKITILAPQSDGALPALTS